jgi:CheY-like chemotaxis protein
LCYTPVRSRLNVRFMSRLALRLRAPGMQTWADMAEKHSSGESHRLLIAAESVAEGFSVAGWLEREGFDVMTASDGQDPLQIACSSWQPDVVLLDLTLPGVDGFSVFKQVRAKNRTAVIFVLGDGSEEDEVRSLKAGAADYVARRFSPEVLLARVRTHLRSRRPAANPTAWRPLAGCEELRNPGKGRVGRAATAGVLPTNSLGAVLRGARESPRADPTCVSDVAGRLQPHLGGYFGKPAAEPKLRSG